MDITLRHETPDDFYAVEKLTRDTFWGVFFPTCDEHLVAHLLRSSPAFVPELDYVAEHNGRLVGNIMFSKAQIVSADGSTHEVLTFGPLTVLPEYQKCGVGSLLLRRTIPEARQLGYRAIVLHGHPDYYPRHGFIPASRFGITDMDGGSYDALMAMELYEGALNGINGGFREDEVFFVKPDEVAEFDRRFPPKPPAAMTPVSLLLEKLPPDARSAFISHKIPNLEWLKRFSGREIARWDGIDRHSFGIMNDILAEYGFAVKCFPEDN